MIHVKQTDPFYRSKRWERMRLRILRRDGYMCQVSKRYGKRTPATTVHHIFPREEFPEYAWAEWNLISLSAAVHNQMHDRTTGALTEAGIELLRWKARKEKIPIPEKYAA